MCIYGVNLRSRLRTVVEARHQVGAQSHRRLECCYGAVYTALDVDPMIHAAARPLCIRPVRPRPTQTRVARVTTSNGCPGSCTLPGTGHIPLAIQPSRSTPV